MSADVMMPLQAVSTVMSAQSQLASGDTGVVVAKRRQQLADFQAQQLDINANNAAAAGQIAALNQNRQTSLVMSQARARAAASGGGASDPTIINLMAQIAGEGEYRAAVDLYNGMSEAQGMQTQANALRYQGATELADARAARNASGFSAATTLLSGAAQGYSLFSKYGQKTT